MSILEVLLGTVVLSCWMGQFMEFSVPETIVSAIVVERHPAPPPRAVMVWCGAFHGKYWALFRGGIESLCFLAIYL